MRNGGAGAAELTVRLEDPNDLFEARAADAERGLAPEPPAIDRIREELSLHRRPPGATVTIELPEEKATAEVRDGLRKAMRRYCEIGIRKYDYELAAIRRDGLRTLLSGAVVLAIGLAVSEAVLRTRSIPKELRDFLGNGLFLVVAWVGLWYPLDTLFYSGRPFRHERKVLEMLREAEIVVRAVPGVPTEPLPEPALGDQSLTGG
jgi:hypothetical protein